MLTEDLRPWLIEINSSPSMARTTRVTAELVDCVLEDTVKGARSLCCCIALCLACMSLFAMILSAVLIIRFITDFVFGDICHSCCSVKDFS